MSAAIAAVAAIGAVVIGYLFRRREHLRERRVEANEKVLAAFLAASRSGADLSSAYMQFGWPRDLHRGDPMADFMQEEMADAWAIALEDRRRFEVASFGADLVGNTPMREYVESLRKFLDDVFYSGSPWKRGPSPDRHVEARKSLAPSEIEPAAIEVARSFVRRTARELWRGDAPAPDDDRAPAS